MVTIFVKKTDEVYFHASGDGGQTFSGHGLSEREAIGDLIKASPEKFGLQIESIDRPQT
jgi:hypothetical protein